MQKGRLYHLEEAVQLADNVIANRPRYLESDMAPAISPLPTVAQTASPSILVIDDSSTVRKLVEIALSSVGYVVISFPDGIAALRWLTAGNCSVPELALLDINLPKIDGYKLAHILNVSPALQGMTIIMMSRRNGTVDHLKGRLAGAKEYLTKPFQMKDLVETVSHYLDKQRG